MSTPTLSPSQAHALFDILTHHETYQEIENFKWPDAIDKYGHPFRKEDGVQTSSPLLQMLLNKFALRLPGLSSVAPEFWQDRCQILVAKLAEAELSESYDKGAIGSRKTLATAISTLLEYVARGCLGGYPRKEARHPHQKYNTSKAEDIVHAWDNALQELIYGDLIDELFDKTAETGKLEDHSSLVQAAHEYILLNLASFLHHVFILSPDGQYLLRVIEHIHRLVPYTLLRQTLRVGNAATMINGMVKLILTKLSVTAFTNWMGLSNNVDDGMNLLQQIISTVMSWDNTEFHKRAIKIEKSKEAPSKEHLDTVKSHVQAPREDHERLRTISIEQSKSIITVILESADPSVSAFLPDPQHAHALEYYSTHLSIRDRDELTKILCRLQPDLLTQAIRDLVAAYDPIIRSVHQAVDLSGTLTDFENFLNDMIKTSKLNKAENGPKNSGAKADLEPKFPCVEDYVALLRKHIPSVHRFLHQVAKNGPVVTGMFRTYAKEAVAEFRDPTLPPAISPSNSTNAKPSPSSPAAGSMTAPLTALFSILSPSEQKDVLAALDKHAKYLQCLRSSSNARLKAILKNNKATEFGPGVYLARWHSLLDSAPITPATAQGPVRKGKEVKEEHGEKLEVDGKVTKRKGKRHVNEVLEEPDVSVVVRLLGGMFTEVLKGMEVMG
ncbi:hypothetical protein K432DRAFT_386305 [Lepidopterella palustris CBS 459.81]|uniref:Uncharacterized protein n=1 Tax=Lepidopterella palustris CBS 459.81 TaxID=1314670 RepID=A0A8E2E0S1_9PEZI|nr:hypothetical protein K432DRAFT_386305 [Lepidopterella palustris CBS 459.81]